MLAQGGGRIWLREGLGSNGPALAGPGPYGATKAGVTWAYRVLAKECRDTHVSVGFLRPGIMPRRVTLDEQASQQQMPRLSRLLSDRPEVVARSFAPRIFRADRNGQRITWLYTRSHVTLSADVSLSRTHSSDVAWVALL